MTRHLRLVHVTTKIFVLCVRCSDDIFGTIHRMCSISDQGELLGETFSPTHELGAKYLAEGNYLAKYVEMFPRGFDVEWVEDPTTHGGFCEMRAQHERKAKGGAR